MSASNWNRDRDMSPEGNNRYRIDGIGLQLGLNLPIQMMGVSLLSDLSTHGHNNADSSWKPWYVGSPDRITENEIQETVDGIPIRKVYITNINIDVPKQEIFYIFGRFGQIVHTFIGVSKNDRNKQFGFITYMYPKDASRVLYKRKFLDFKGRTIYVTAADSWHQPKEGPDGQIIWDRRPHNKRDEESDEDLDQTVDAAMIPVEPVVNSEEGLNMLNDDCLLHIFSFFSFKELTRLEQVCKRWQGLSFRMWKCLHSLDFNKKTFSGMQAQTPVLEQYLRRCGESLTELDLSVMNNAFTESTLAVVAKYCPNLEVLRVFNIQMGNRSLAHLGRSCPKLKELDIEGCSKFTDKDLMSLLPKCQQLTRLDLSHANSLTGRCLLNIQGPIQSLKLWNCANINISYLIQGLQKISKSLESLALSSCGNMRSCNLSQVVSAAPHLTSLSLCHCMPLYDDDSLSHVGRLSRLIDLNLSFNNGVNDNSLAAIVEGCPALSVVNLSGSGKNCNLTERGLSVLARLPNLTVLDISYMEMTTDIALKSIAARSSRLKRLLCRGCPDLTNEGSIPIVTMCNELELFDLSGCQLISYETVVAATTSVKIRTNGVPLKLVLGGTDIEAAEVKSSDCPLLTLDLSDLSDEHLRPDFNSMFFPPSDSDEEEDLDHLCERIGCDCDFDFDDMFDPTLCIDSSIRFGRYLDEDLLSDCDDYENN